MGEAENISLYRRLAENLNAGRLEIFDELLAPDIELPTIAPAAEPTIAGLKQLNEAFRAGFPDLHGTLEESFANGDWVAARVTWTGTNAGELLGQPPTGKTVSLTELEIVGFENGRIVDLRQLADLAGLMAQLSDE
jgi:predicted ester cyclase